MIHKIKMDKALRASSDLCAFASLRLCVPFFLPLLLIFASLPLHVFAFPSFFLGLCCSEARGKSTINAMLMRESL